MPDAAITREVIGSIRLPAPPEEVFRFVTDPSNVWRVLPSVQHAEAVTRGPLRPGARFRCRGGFRGASGRLDLVVTDCLEPHRVTIEGRDFAGDWLGPLPELLARATWQLEPHDEGSRAQLHIACELHPRRGSLRSALVRVAFERILPQWVVEEEVRRALVRLRAELATRVRGQSALSVSGPAAASAAA